jgi:hypothetical protein
MGKALADLTPFLAPIYSAIMAKISASISFRKKTGNTLFGLVRSTTVVALWLVLVTVNCAHSSFAQNSVHAFSTAKLVHTVPIILPPALQKSLPENPIRADQLFPVFNQGGLSLRMEALRRAALRLDNAEKERLWAFLNKRRDANVNDPNLYFDVGYADVTLHMNKTGLFFLRKASERLNDPFALLAYGMAQADVDLYVEGGNPSTPSMRKLDVVYKLSDAIALGVKKPQFGLWPTFVAIQQQLSAIPAYADFSQRDYSDTLVPYGERASYATFNASTNLCLISPVSRSSVGNANSTSVGGQSLKPLFSQPVQLGGGQWSTGRGGQPQCLDFFPDPGQRQHYTIHVRDGQTLLGQFESNVGLSIIEDLDHDGTYELVVRQFHVNRLHPIQVYRLQQNQLRLDTKIQQLFE